MEVISIERSTYEELLTNFNSFVAQMRALADRGTDIVRAINDEEDYVKAGNYWRWLKKKLSTDGIQLVSVTHDFKFEAPDGKQRFADALDSDCVQTLAENYPNNRARSFLHWFTYSDNSIDGQSKKKAYTLVESGLLETLKPGTVKALQQIHAYLFGGLYDFAGKIRTKTIVKGNTLFCLAEHLHNYLKIVLCDNSGHLMYAKVYVFFNIVFRINKALLSINVYLCRRKPAKLFEFGLRYGELRIFGSLSKIGRYEQMFDIGSSRHHGCHEPAGSDGAFR